MAICSAAVRPSTPHRGNPLVVSWDVPVKRSRVDLAVVLDLFEQSFVSGRQTGGDPRGRATPMFAGRASRARQDCVGARIVAGDSDPWTH